MNWFKSTIEGAGLKRFGASPILVGMLTLSALTGVVASAALSIPAFGLFLALGVLAFQFETLSLLAKVRRRKVAKLWPEVLDSVHSAIVSGLSLNDAFDDLAIQGPKAVRQYFLELANSVDSGVPFQTAMDSLKSSVGEAHVDKFCEVLCLAYESGSESLSASLAQQSRTLRDDLSLAGRLEAQQSWVVGTAKIAVAAPWIVVAMLSVRQENAQVYNSTLGSQILLTGFLVCAVAYRLVNSLGQIPSQTRFLVR